MCMMSGSNYFMRCFCFPTFAIGTSTLLRYKYARIFSDEGIVGYRLAPSDISDAQSISFCCQSRFIHSGLDREKELDATSNLRQKELAPSPYLTNSKASSPSDAAEA